MLVERSLIAGKGATGSRRDKAIQLQLGQWLTVSVSPFTDEKGQICTLNQALIFIIISFLFVLFIRIKFSVISDIPFTQHFNVRDLGMRPAQGYPRSRRATFSVIEPSRAEVFVSHMESDFDHLKKNFLTSGAAQQERGSP